MTEELTYEQAMDRFDETLKKLESDRLSLEEAVQAAQDASRYFQIAAKRLEEATRKIEVRSEEQPPE